MSKERFDKIINLIDRVDEIWADVSKRLDEGFLDIGTHDNEFTGV